MALPYTFTNTGHPTIDADQVNANYTYLDTGKNRESTQTVTFGSDGSVTATVTYSPAFGTATDVIRGIVFVNYTGTDFATLVYKISNVTQNGFTIEVGGGQSGTQVDVHYSVIGH